MCGLTCFDFDSLLTHLVNPSGHQVARRWTSTFALASAQGGLPGSKGEDKSQETHLPARQTKRKRTNMNKHINKTQEDGHDRQTNQIKKTSDKCMRLSTTIDGVDVSVDSSMVCADPTRTPWSMSKQVENVGDTWSSRWVLADTNVVLPSQ